MKLQILPAQDSDKTLIESLFEDCFGKDAFMYRHRKIEKFKVVKIDGELVAAGAVLLNSMHASVPRVIVAVNSSFRRKKIGTQLHQALIDANPGYPLGYDGCCYDGDLAAIGFMQALGYGGYLDCFIPVIDIKAGIRDLEGISDIQFLTLEDALKSGVNRQSVIQFLQQLYCETHDWSPVSIPAGDPAWDEIALGDADPQLSSVGLYDGKIVAVSTANIDDKNVLQIVWPFAVQVGKYSELSVLRELLSYQFKLATGKAIETTTFELDSNVPSNVKLPASFHILSSETWRRFRYKA
jgi:GNAT superfamily N-acetyltransferase